MQLSRLTAVLFDLDNTLLDRDGAFERCLKAEFDSSDVRQELRRLDDCGRGCRKTLFQAWSNHTGHSLTQSGFVHKLSQNLFPRPALLESLKRLRHTHKIGLISNGGSQSQRTKLKAAGLDSVFPANRIWISAEVGLAKPDPKLFWMACEALNEQPRNCLYVGDQEEVDGAGARAAGLWYQRGWPL